jgi:hypothetical protein
MAAHPALRTTRILWFALLVACFMYVGLAFGGFFPRPVVAPEPIMPIAFAGVAAMLSAASFLMPRMVYAGAARAADLATQEEVAPDGYSQKYREAMPKSVVFADPNAARNKAYALFMTPFILSLALSEAIALFGLVLSVLGFEKTVCAPFFAVGAVLILIRFPSEPSILAALERARGASFPKG